MALAICRRNKRMVLSLSVTLAVGQREVSIGGENSCKNYACIKQMYVLFEEKWVN